MWTVLKAFIENLLQYCFCFMFWFFGHEVCWILAPQPGIEPALPALESEILTTGLRGRSQKALSKKKKIYIYIYTHTQFKKFVGRILYSKGKVLKSTLSLERSVAFFLSAMLGNIMKSETAKNLVQTSTPWPHQREPSKLDIRLIVQKSS